MNPKNVVGVWVLGRPGEPDRFATGFALAPNRVLTVAHVFKPGDARILVWFIYYPDHCDNRPVEAHVVWPRQDSDAAGLDAMMLEVPSPPDIQSTVAFLEAPPQVLSDWQSNCFPAFVRDAGAPGKDHYLPAHGKFTATPPDLPCFPLDCAEKRPVPVDWSGASGGPVFVGARLAGLIKGIHLGASMKDGQGNAVAPYERLVAVPAWKLLAAAGFRDSLGGVNAQELEKSEQAWRRKLIARIRNVLKQIQETLVADRFEEYFDGRSWPADTDACVELAGQLVDQPELIFRLLRIRVECREKKLDDAAKLLIDVENCLLPRLFTSEERRRFLNELRHSGAMIVERAATCPEAIELRMANVDGRECQLVPASAAARPASSRAPSMLSLGTVLPGDPSAEQTAHRILVKLAGQGLPGDQNPNTIAARARLRGEKPMAAVDAANVESEQLGKRLAKALQTRKQIMNATQYCVLRVQDTGLERPSLLAAVAVLRRWLPDLVFLELSDDCPFGDQETPMLTLLETR